MSQRRYKSVAVRDVDNIAQAAADTLSEPLTLELRSMANAAGWPAYLISVLMVDYEDGDLVINYPEDVKEQIENLEYGDINSLPTPVLRPFSYRIKTDIDSVLEKQSLGALMVKVGIV